MTQINQRCAVLGKPIAHSLSPVLHMAAYRALGLDDWSYGRHEVGEDDLDGFLRGLDPSWRGLSLTMPLKKTIQPYGTPADYWADQLKVANTAVFDWSKPGSQEGLPHIDLYNTDVPGIIYAIQHACDVTQRQTLLDHAATAAVIGNGNTAESALSAICAMFGASDATDRNATVIARHPGRNTDIAGIVAAQGDGGIGYAETHLDHAADVLAGSDIVVSTIPGRAADGIAEAIMDDTAFTPRGVLLDVVYDPRPSALIVAWRSKGGIAIGGEEMLLYQAILQVKLMTGKQGERRLQGGDAVATLEPPMRKALEEVL
ncbi:shikimate dehydrogenase family protein [Bifidobacterium leontopitheci]|uniref:Shikimate dehydrogenase n=1 Tax=Bifidobacterium leontopitheci TaxID=2650774 RepID=A0A6I1GGM2_9BIFI|nr:shikimate dehydrogenase [Bifidobacterium leontopitheci]KAB7790804.1 shikimate dehydrogenase [Bifidobacterium leontopitheci]